MEPKLEYLENLNEIGKTEPTGSLRRRSRKHRTSTLPRNIRSSMTSPSNGVLGVEGLRLKYESIGDRIINTRNYGQILLEQMEIWQSSFFKARNFIKDLRQSGTISFSWLRTRIQPELRTSSLRNGHRCPLIYTWIEILKGSSALINATSEVGEAVRAGNAVIQTSKNKLETEPLDLNDILEEINKELVHNPSCVFIGWRF